MPLPPDVEELLDKHICDFEQLEISLFLRSSSSRSWTASELITALPMPEDLLLEALSQLQSDGLLSATTEPVPQYRYAPRTFKLESAMTDLSVIYRDNRVAIISRLSLNAINRIKLRTVRAFSDAFVVTRGSKKGKEGQDG